MQPSLVHVLRACISVAPLATPLFIFGFIICFGYTLWMDDPWILFRGDILTMALFLLTMCSGLTLAVFGGHIELESEKLAREEARKKFGAIH